MRGRFPFTASTFISARGFTLTELIMVIVILGILGVGITSFITNTVGGYVDTAERQGLANAGMIGSEKLSRELRMALPNSVRLNASRSCVEYIPILAATTYLSIPLNTAANSIPAVGAQLSASVSGRAVVYPISQSQLYAPGSPGIITSATATLPAGSDAITVSLSGNHQFTTESPTRRLYIVGTPRAWCVVGGNLYQYSGYGFNSSVSLPPSGGNRTLLLNNVSSATNVFDYNPATLVRNAVINFRFVLSDGGDTWQTEQEVHIRNVP